MSDGLKKTHISVVKEFPCFVQNHYIKTIYWYANSWRLLQFVSHVLIINVAYVGNCMISTYFFNMDHDHMINADDD